MTRHPRRRIVEYLDTGGSSFWTGMRQVRLSCGHLEYVVVRVLARPGGIREPKATTAGGTPRSHRAYN